MSTQITLKIKVQKHYLTHCHNESVEINIHRKMVTEEHHWPQKEN